MLVPNFLERLRTLVGSKSWDYIVLWKLTDDHRCVEWMDCCCAGTENVQNGEEQQLLFPAAASALPCRDVMSPHPRTKSCDLIEQLPAFITMESGIHVQTLLSNQASWFNFSHNLDSNVSEETIGTRVLIPWSLGITELFVTKQVPEDQQVIDFVRTQCNIFLEQAMSNSGTMESSFSLSANGIQVSPEPLKENLDLPHDISIERIHLRNSSMNISNLQQFRSTGGAGNANSDIFFKGAHVSNPFTSLIENGFQEMETLQSNIFSSQVRDDDSFTRDNFRSDDSDPNDDDEDAAKYGRRIGKGPPSKNLMAERKRRQKLNDKLYSLRALVPKISKLDRASILGDAIDYVMELQKQVKELQIELEEHSDDEEARKTSGTNSNDNSIQPGVMYQSGMKRPAKHERENYLKVSHRGPSANGGNSISKQNYESENANEKLQQMEVEVFQLGGNEVFVKIFWEHKSSGFVKLLEVLNSLGLEITDANATRHTCLASNVFRVEKKDSETIQADHIRETLLELTRSASRMWAEMDKKSENGNIDHDHHHHLLYDYSHRSLSHNNPQMNPQPVQHLHC